MLVPEQFYIPPVGSSDELVQSLPAMSMWDKGVLDHEKETVFRDSWLCMPKQLIRQFNPDVRSIYARPAPGHPYIDVLKGRGNATKIRTLGESVMLFRGSEPKGNPELRCFKNMCPHARYPMLEVAHDSDGELYIKCEQHGLVCNEYGKFVSHRAFPNATPEQRRRLSMPDYKVREWFDFFFIARTDSPPYSFEDTMRPVWESLARLPLDEFKYRSIGAEQRIVEGNWKLQALNYEDWLHIRDIHKRPSGLADAMDLESARMELYDDVTLMWAYAADPADGFDPKFLPDRFKDPSDPDGRRVYALWWFVYPNLTLNFYPWGLSVNIYMPAMVDTERMKFDPEKTEFLWYHYVWDEAKYRDIDSRWLNEQVDFEDVEAIKYIAENLRSHAHPRSRGLFGNLMTGPNTETGPWWLNRKIYNSMFEPHAEVMIPRVRKLYSAAAI
ncbi:MAG: hypothetical protein A2754_00130 [Candidatus Magasanikbacteria bacterium RIFCSPHIGHO2_01_FULL_47_8]|uniref:Rieske domain-containing protein n=1 Tax=Candidatus Magasanikbacteria bacterium RIFCSPHIGHO2_01_FULL_47_8 TaxID=1798673 RepID=A0A1F6MCR1_9BACT|nr:MAG: hypothetical protein A2754_00130 [Candidatus Magasanikbacteria bacterium RIFCSPHIGHO2_01_FULL_47_8]